MNKELAEKIDLFEKVISECPEIVFIGDKVLRTKTQDVSLEEGIVIGKKLIEVLQKYRTLSGFGRGLTAPQIGVSKSVFVAFVDEVFTIYMNPRIISSEDRMNLYREMCISCGPISVDVKRPTGIKLEYLSESGEIITKEFDSFLARLIQHENDHLNGVVNVDQGELGSIEFMTRNPLEEKLREI